jgi:hypothetical protein
MGFPQRYVRRSSRPDVRLISLWAVLVLSFLFTGPARAAPAMAGHFKTDPQAGMALANSKLGCDVTYRVRPGDTLSRIARRCGVTVAELQQANNLLRRTRLWPGQILQIPRRAPVTPAAEADPTIVTAAAPVMSTPTAPPDLRKHYLPTPALEN